MPMISSNLVKSVPILRRVRAASPPDFYRSSVRPWLVYHAFNCRLRQESPVVIGNSRPHDLIECWFTDCVRKGPWRLPGSRPGLPITSYRTATWLLYQPYTTDYPPIYPVAYGRFVSVAVAAFWYTKSWNLTSMQEEYMAACTAYVEKAGRENKAKLTK